MTQYDMNNLKEYTVLRRYSEFGRTRILIRCPFCSAEFWAYVWSLCGGGKKCEGCGALHGSLGARAIIKKDKK